MHLGLGSFVRAHLAWYTDRAPDAAEWGIAGFTGRSPDLARALAAQDGLYTLVTRGPVADRFDVVGSIASAHAAADTDAWLDLFRDPALAVVTATVTEAGWLRAADGGLASAAPSVRADVAALRAGRPGEVRSAPGRLVAGMAARRAADAGPLALVPCDNVSGNGDVARRVVTALADLVDPALATWLTESVAFGSTVVDRITPRGQDEDRRTVAAATGREDRAPVVTEPFSEWVLQGDFPGGSPRWEDAGAVRTDDVTPFEHRKLWLLNGGHSLLAYAGSLRGLLTVDAAAADPLIRGWLEQWWDEAVPHLPMPAAETAGYRAALLERFANPRIRHELEQVAADGSAKLPERVLPVLRLERSAGRLPLGAARILAAWVGHLRGHDMPVSDPEAPRLVSAAHGPWREAVARVLAALDPALADDPDLVAAVADLGRELAAG